VRQVPHAVSRRPSQFRRVHPSFWVFSAPAQGQPFAWQSLVVRGELGVALLTSAVATPTGVTVAARADPGVT